MKQSSPDSALTKLGKGLLFFNNLLGLPICALLASPYPVIASLLFPCLFGLPLLLMYLGWQQEGKPIAKEMKAIFILVFSMVFCASWGIVALVKGEAYWNTNRYILVMVLMEPLLGIGLLVVGKSYLRNRQS